MEPVNPYTGVALKDETAIALLHLQNEDSLLFWTIRQLKGADLAQLKQLYGQWLVQKYGSLAAAKSTWRGASLPGDEPARQSMALYPIWQLTQPVRFNPPKARRLEDQTEFLTTTMRQFNQEMVQFLREEVGVKQLINANNWKTASTPRLNDAERYSYTTTDVIGINRYYGGGEHKGKHQGWAIVNGDHFSNRSILFDPLSFPLALKQVAGYPLVVSESSWVPPLNYQSEGPFLISAYRSLLGIDGYYWFSFQHQPQWRQPASANGYLPSLGKWTAATPELLGNFPAAALLYRRGYLQAAPPVVQEQRSLTGLWQRKIPLIHEEAGFDPNRDQAQEKRQRPGRGSINPLAFLVGPVQTRFVTKNNESNPNPSEALTRWINPEQQQVQSATQEIVWDYGQGIARINAPKAQGVTGFLAQAGEITLNTVTITAHNHYATVLVVSLDGKPLAQSEKVLIQVGTQARPTNWRQRPVTWKDKQKQKQQGFEVLNYGQAPWRIVNNDLAIAIRNPNLTTATLLDMNGVAKAGISSQRTHQALTFQMPAAGKYVLLSR